MDHLDEFGVVSGGMTGEEEFAGRPGALNTQNSFGLPALLGRGDSLLNPENIEAPAFDPSFDVSGAEPGAYEYLGTMDANSIMSMINQPGMGQPGNRNSGSLHPDSAHMGNSLLPTPPISGVTNLAETLPIDAGAAHQFNANQFGVEVKEESVEEPSAAEEEEVVDEGPRLLVTHQLIHWIGTPDNASGSGADAKEYWLQKGKVFNIKVQLFDGYGNTLTDAANDIELAASLVYDNEAREEVRPINSDVMTGEKTAKTKEGTIQFKLKMQVNSSQRDDQKFRVCIKPTDAKTAENKNLWAFSEPVRVIAKLTKAKAQRAQNTIEAPAGESSQAAEGDGAQWADQISSQLHSLKDDLQTTQSQVQNLQSNLTQEQKLRLQLEEENRRLREAVKKKRKADDE